ncbi:hypothetical protein ACF0H5_019447 [Mactra antiquata]
MLISGLILLLCTGFKFSNADYDCLCSYAIDIPIYEFMDTSSNIVGYMQEFACKQLVHQLTNSWTVILENHKTGYVQKTGSMVVQMCQGSPEVIPSTLAPTIVSSTIPTSTITTTLPASPSISVKTTTASFKSTATPTVSVPTPVPSQKPTVPVTHTPRNTSTLPQTTSPSISILSSNTTINVPSSTVTPQPFKTTNVPSSTVSTTQATTTVKSTTIAPKTAMATTRAQTTATPTTKATKTTMPPTKAPLTTVSTTRATTTKATTTRPPFNILNNIFGRLGTCPADVISAARYNNGFVQMHAGSCYELVPYWYTWQYAENNCLNKEGHLVHISNQDEENFILNFLYSHGFNHAVWTGLNDRYHEESFTWSSGARFMWENWIPGRKSNFYDHVYEDCVVYVPYTNHYAHWDDVDCKRTHPWICRYDQAHSNITSSLIGREVK